MWESTVDSDGNGLPDWWEMKYFGHLGVDPNDDPDRDGLSNLQEYQNHTPPLDYYNGTPPTVSYYTGDTQQADPWTWSQPLVIALTDSQGNILNNAPVTFTVTQGDGILAPSPDDPNPAGQLTVYMDPNTGTASVYYQFPGAVNDTSTITATFGPPGSQTTLTFSLSTNPPPAVVPSDVVAIKNADGSTNITWTDNSDDEDGFVIERQRPDGTWEQIGFVGPNTTTFHAN
jgi:hypothetical protein